MNSNADISLVKLLFGFIILLIPILLLWLYKVKIVKSIVVSAARMVVQLALVAVYLEWVFNLNSAWVNTIWVFVMVLVGTITTINRVSLNWRVFVVPFLIAGISSVLIIDTFFLGFIINLEYVFDARYFIPITGMILGNSLKHNIVGLSAYFKGLSEKTELYQFLLTNTASKKIALRPFIADALKQALNPMIASMSVVGLISLPGMMTGQILGGSSPATAIKYQIMIMLAIFVGCTLNLFLSIILSNRSVFNGYHNFKPEVLKGKLRHKKVKA